MKTSRNGIAPVRRSFLIACAALIGLGSAWAGSGRCYTADVASTVVLPDGSSHAPGSLRLCELRTLTPVSSLHSIQIDGRPIGMFISRSQPTERSGGQQAFIAFRLNDRGALELEGYAVPNGDRLQSHFLVSRDKVSRADRTAQLTRDGPDEKTRTRVLLAQTR